MELDMVLVPFWMYTKDLRVSPQVPRMAQFPWKKAWPLLMVKNHAHPFKLFMFSLEPGYYEDGKFGIRIENVMIVQKKSLPQPTFGNTQFYQFETVTMVRFYMAQ
jgi:hypothetical protein